MNTVPRHIEEWRASHAMNTSASLTDWLREGRFGGPLTWTMDEDGVGGAIWVLRMNVKHHEDLVRQRRGELSCCGGTDVKGKPTRLAEPNEGSRPS